MSLEWKKNSGWIYWHRYIMISYASGELLVWMNRELWKKENLSMVWAVCIVISLGRPKVWYVCETTPPYR